MRVEFHPDASDELAEAAAYYDMQSPGLGERFLHHARETADAITDMPLRGRELLPGIRKLKVRRFPFGVIYQPETDRIFILAVAHLMREPNYWKHRAT